MREDIDCLTIGTVAVKHLSHKFPDSDIHLLAYSLPKEFESLLPSNTSLFDLKGNQWPDDILKAMEWFFEIAADVVKHEYTSIINLDTAFMPCMLARFLKDAGEPVVGNYINMDVQQLISKLVEHTLQPEYVNEMLQYLASTFVGMSRWRQFWWQSDIETQYGYPEFYLRHCCGFDDLDYEFTIDVEANHTLAKQQSQKVLALSSGFDDRTGSLMKEASKQLAKLGFIVWNIDLQKEGYLKTLKKIKASTLAVIFSEPSFWLAKAVKCQTLLMCEGVEPLTMMPDYSTEPNVNIEVSELVADITSLLLEGNS